MKISYNADKTKLTIKRQEIKLLLLTKQIEELIHGLKLRKMSRKILKLILKWLKRLQK